ncbi:MAG: hypothetical protein H7A49_00335 [Akkermansiaceae bacterium]|nr:hypothetical protein [Akkermansiaceae bacterium]
MKRAGMPDGSIVYLTFPVPPVHAMAAGSAGGLAAYATDMPLPVNGGIMLSASPTHQVAT